MDYLISAMLGVVEGLTEFLPVSSTAHLRVAQKLFNLPLETPFWKTYTIVIQLGAVLCLPVYFWKRIRKFVSTFPRGERGDRNVLTHPLSLTMLAFIVTAIPAYLLSKKIGENLDNFYVIGAALLIGGAVMWAVDVMFKRPRITHMEEMGPLQAIWIGAVQILAAVFPGTSRSMATIAAGQAAGMSRAAALEFSFFVSIPTMAAATGYALLKAIFPKANAAASSLSPASMTLHEWIVLAIGFVISFFVALGSVAFLMAWVRRHGFVPFAIYRIVLGIAILIWARSMHG
ncbi:MAG: undecaprenyl-diphosphate phosphatase [Anaerolineae bacterium]|nr:undecaprenyl-diphosphate phosphatase [Phycisphaerae bacterium]